MARLAPLLALALGLSACLQDISGLDAVEPPDAGATDPEPDAGGASPAPDAAGQARPDAGAQPRPDAAAASAPDAAAFDAGTCAVSPSPARLGQEVTITCPAQPSLGGPTWWASGVAGVDGGYALVPGPSAGAATFTLASVPKNFPDSALQVRATWHGAGGDGVATAQVEVLGNLFVARGSSPQHGIAAFTTSPTYAKWGGEQTGDAVGVTELDSAPRALGLLSSGDILVAQTSKASVAPPVIVISRKELKRLRDLDFAARDLIGEVLFDVNKSVHPRAVAQMSDGSVWVTGGPLPVIYKAGNPAPTRPQAAAVPSAKTVGLAQLANGQVAVSMGNLKIGLYSLDGTSYDEIEPLYGGAGYR